MQIHANNRVPGTRYALVRRMLWVVGAVCLVLLLLSPTLVRARVVDEPVPGASDSIGKAPVGSQSEGIRPSREGAARFMVTDISSAAATK